MAVLLSCWSSQLLNRKISPTKDGRFSFFSLAPLHHYIVHRLLPNFHRLPKISLSLFQSLGFFCVCRRCVRVAPSGIICDLSEPIDELLVVVVVVGVWPLSLSLSENSSRGKAITSSFPPPVPTDYRRRLIVAGQSSYIAGLERVERSIHLSIYLV